MLSTGHATYRAKAQHLNVAATIIHNTFTS